MNIKENIDTVQLKIDFAEYILSLKKSGEYTDDIGIAAGEISVFIDWLEKNRLTFERGTEK